MSLCCRFLIVLVIILFISAISACPVVAEDVNICKGSSSYNLTIPIRDKIKQACNEGGNHILSKIYSCGYDYDEETGHLTLYKCQNIKFDFKKNAFIKENRITYSCGIDNDGATVQHLVNILDYITTANELNNVIDACIKDTSYTVGMILATAIGGIEAKIVGEIFGLADIASFVKFVDDHSNQIKQISYLYEKISNIYNTEITKHHCVICGTLNRNNIKHDL